MVPEGQNERGVTEPGKVEQWRAQWRKTGRGSAVLERTGQGEAAEITSGGKTVSGSNLGGGRNGSASEMRGSSKTGLAKNAARVVSQFSDKSGRARKKQLAG